MRNDSNPGGIFGTTDDAVAEQVVLSAGALRRLFSYSNFEITVGEVIRTLEGSMAPVDCLLGDGDGCRDGRCCPGRIVWERIYDSVNHVMDSLTLEELAEEYMEQ